MNVPAGLEQVVGDAATSAREVEAVNRQLSKQERVDPQTTAAVDALALGVAATAKQWQAVDPDAAAIVLTSAIEAQHAALRADEPDARNALRLALGRMLYALTQLAEGGPVSAERDPKEVARWLVEHAEVPQTEIAGLLGTPVRTLQRWISDAPTAPSGEDAARLRLIAQLFAQLRHVFTPAGAVRWLRAPNGHLDGRVPVEVVAQDPVQAAALVEHARSLRFQVSS